MMNHKLLYNCEYCGENLSSRSNLKTHQLKTKYCLNLQDKNKQCVIEVNTCQYCFKEFSHKHNKTTHESTCVGRDIKIRYDLKMETQKCEYEKINSSQKEEIQQLKIEIEKLKSEKEIYNSLFQKEHEFVHKQAEKSSVTNNIKSKNVNMNSLNLTQERLNSIKDTYTIKHYEQGGIGQADWVIDNVLKDEDGTLVYKCTDKNRRNFIYRDNQGNIVTDIHAKKLKEAILPIMSNKLREYKKIKYNELADLDDDENELLDKCNNLYIENKSLGPEFDKRLVEKTYN